MKNRFLIFTILLGLLSCASPSTDFKSEFDKYLSQYKSINNYEHFMSKLFESDSKEARAEKIANLFTSASENPEAFQAMISGIDKHATHDLLSYFESNFGDSKNYSAFQKVVLSQNDKNIGNEIENFMFTDKEGNRININDFEGKLIVIDFWATWCKPCLALEDDYKKVVKKFESNKNVQFLSIAVRQSHTPWIKHIEGDDYENLIHARFEDQKDIEIPLGVFDLLSIPKFGFISKDQKVIFSNGPQPGSLYFEELITENSSS